MVHRRGKNEEKTASSDRMLGDIVLNLSLRSQYLWLGCRIKCETRGGTCGVGREVDCSET